MSDKQDLKLTATPEEEDFGHKYTEEGSGKIGSKLLDKYFSTVESLVARSGIHKLKSATAIELGCGEGFSTQRLRELLPENIELEASEYVGKLVPAAGKRNPGVRVMQESVYDLQRPDKSFDIVFLLEVLEHLDYPDVALKEIHRILKDDGVLVLGVPREPLWRGLNMLRGKYLRDFGNTVGHLNHWSAKGLEKYVSQNFGPVVERKNPLPWTLVLAKKHAEK